MVRLPDSALSIRIKCPVTATEKFIAKYDCPAFDPEYYSLPLEFFVPAVMRLFEKPVNSIYKKAMG